MSMDASKFLTPRNRVILYSLWSASSTILTAYGVALPGGQQAWDQFLFAVLGVGTLGCGALAIKHTPTSQPPPGASCGGCAGEPDAGETAPQPWRRSEPRG
ncbi:hypothetical protein Srot_0853 [Segniliparus rotundus DSM 44985]|uniref:Uncharacterized protein n=1 Tax=Segniliparus rotundus (strain ATCC BAA-972 / CDC 1076 / CIP 108378 / DSM 44985 / JCM 13578) TaxID=640132 RepID=D6ZE52_SEGRD|nr:hypothetical protein [Segniliparus rotundus]ADG97332.1 hypothetical protein Srot_0853 [Segniliparus rotundus DSM 44985]